MKKKIIIKIIIVFLLVILINNVSYGEVIDPVEFDPSSTISSNTLAEGIIEKILGGVQGIGSIVSVLALVIIGIRYMLGSVEEKAEYKQTMIPYVVGAILLFLSSNIVGALYNIFK